MPEFTPEVLAARKEVRLTAQRRRRARAKRRGKCRTCTTQPAQAGKSRCAGCEETSAKAAKKLAKTRRKAGQCRCGRPHTGRGYCADCKKHRRALPSARGPNVTRARRRREEVCEGCGDQPLSGKRDCAVCADIRRGKERDRAAEYRAAGRCAECGRPRGKPVTKARGSGRPTTRCGRCRKSRRLARLRRAARA